jgi:transglutaminase-like putative cysteine protease/Tfp pilus assembly protein PilF
VGPPPVWVQPPPAAGVEKDDIKPLPLAILLNDTQVRLSADGWTEFHRLRVKVQSAQGLQALSTLPFPWSPWSDTLTFHSASILRGGQVIDVLPKTGGFTVLRREPGLEQAMLTGQLTALLQPEDLEVGDLLEVVVSIRHADPLLKGGVGAVFAGWDLTPIVHARFEVSWPSTMQVRWRQSAGMPEPRHAESGGMATTILELDDVRQLLTPAHAPPRFQHGRQVEFTNFSDWKDVAAVFAPLFAKAAELGPQSAVAEQAALIEKQQPDPKARASAALRLVQDQVRYLAHADAGGGYTPQAADETWRLRYGDCKAKTVLLIALLQKLGFQAEPVLASLGGGDGLDEHLPSTLVFNHVFVRTHIADRDYWLDGSRQGDLDIDTAPVPSYGWVLPVESASQGLVQLKPLPAEKPLYVQVIRYDASGGVTAPEPSQFTTTYRGDGAVALHALLAAATPDQIDAYLRSFWAQAHTAFTPTHVAASWDPATSEETFSAEGTSKLDWSGAGLELQHVALGGAPDIKRDPNASDPDAPYVIDYPSYTETDESVVLPSGDNISEAALKAAQVDTVIAGISYHRTATVTGRVVKVVASQRSLQPEISATDARASVKPLTDLLNQTVYVPAGAQANAANNAFALESHPSTADGHIDRGNALLSERKFQEALAEYESAIALDPKSQMAWADRAVAHAWLDNAEAKVDADKADALGSPSYVAANARGLLADRAGDLAVARIAYRHALDYEPTDDFALRRLYPLDLKVHDMDAASRDLERLERLDPSLIALRPKPTAANGRAKLRHAVIWIGPPTLACPQNSPKSAAASRSPCPVKHLAQAKPH